MWCGGRIKFNCSSAGIGDATYIHTLTHIRCSVVVWCGGRIKFNCSSAGIGDATYIHTLTHIRCSVVVWCGGRIKFNCSSAGIGDATYIHTLNHIRCSVGCGVVDVSNSIEVAPVLVMLHTYILLLTSDVVWGVVWWTYQIQL